MTKGFHSLLHLTKEAFLLLKYINQPNWFSSLNVHFSNAVYLLHTTYNRPYIFIHINKTAGSSISKALGYDHQIHMTAKMLQDLLSTEIYQQKYKFAFIRNPYDRVVSQYLYRKKSNQTSVLEVS